MVLIMLKPKYKTLKISILGASQSGKSSLLNRYLHRRFNPCQRATVGINIENTKPRLPGDPSFLFFDLSGHERYQSLLPIFAQGSQHFILVFDSAFPESFSVKKLAAWSRIITNSSSLRNTRFTYSIFLTKSELVGDTWNLFRSLKLIAGRLETNLHKFPLLRGYGSAKTGENIDNFMDTVIQTQFIQLYPTHPEMAQHCLHMVHELQQFNQGVVEHN